MSRGIPDNIKTKKYRFCAACERTDDLQYHHLIPIAHGGKTVPENIIVLCSECHNKMHQQGGVKHNYLVKEGIAKAKAKGITVGRKSADSEKIIKMIAQYSTQFNDIYEVNELKTESEIAEMAGIKYTCYAKYKKILKEAMRTEKWPYTWDKPKIMRELPLYDHYIKRLRRERGDAQN